MRLVALLVLALLPSTAASQSLPDPRVRAGSKFVLTGTGAAVEVFVPADYERKRRYGLLVWIGAADTAPAVSLTGGRRFVCASYPNAKGPRSSIKAAVDEIERTIPNLHAEMRIAAGELAESPDGVAGLLVLGGTLPASGLKGKPVLVASRDEESRPLQQAAAKAGADSEFYLIQGEGNPFPPAAADRLLEWVERKVLLKGIPEAAAAMDRALAGKKWPEALARARLILERPLDARPEYARAKAAIRAINEAGDKALTPLLSNPAAPALRKFVKEWEFCPCAERAAEAASALGEKELDDLLAVADLPRPPRLKTFLKTWDGFHVFERALNAYEQDAAPALEKAAAGPDRAARYAKLKEFVKEWSPAPSAVRAALMRDDVASEALAEAKQAADKAARRSKLEAFLKAYGDSPAAEEARRALREP